MGFFLVCVGELGCVPCNKPFPAGQWSTVQLKNHKSKQATDLICNSCADNGCSARDSNLYKCSTCQRELGHLKYDKHTKFDTGRYNTKLQCMECKTKFPCSACKKLYPPSEWPAKQRLRSGKPIRRLHQTPTDWSTVSGERSPRLGVYRIEG